MVAVVGHENHEVVVVGALEQRRQLRVQQPVEAADAIGDR